MAELEAGDRIIYKYVDQNSYVGVIREKEFNKMIKLVPDDFNVPNNMYNTKDGSITVHPSAIKKYKILVKHETINLNGKWYKRVFK